MTSLLLIKMFCLVDLSFLLRRLTYFYIKLTWNQIFGITIITNKNNTQRVHNLCCPSRPAMKTIHGKIPLYYSFINNSLSDHLHQKIQVIWALQKNFLYPKDTAPKLFFKFYNQYLSNAVFVNWNHFLDVFIHFLYS